MPLSRPAVWLAVLATPTSGFHADLQQVSAAQPAQLIQETHSVSQREEMCRSFVGYWAALGSIDMRLVCRQAYTQAACAAAEKSFGGQWPEPAEVVLQPEAIAAQACQAVELKLTARRGLMLAQKDSLVHASGSNSVRKSISLKRRRRDMPDWARTAPVMWEDPEGTEIPYPLDVPPTTWDGPALTPTSMDQLMTWGGTLPPPTLAPAPAAESNATDTDTAAAVAATVTLAPVTSTVAP